MESNNPYKLLGITENATEDEIRKAFKKVALKWHPDKHPAEKKEEVEHKFKLIVNAYETLIGKTKAEYYVEDAFANFFKSFHKKYSAWTDTWNTPETQEARKEATRKMWAEEDEKINSLAQKKPLYYLDVDVPKSWEQYVAQRGLETPIIITTFSYKEEINSKITFWTGDICSLSVNAIVSSASVELFGDGTLSGKIHRAGGRRLDEECQLIDSCPRGRAVITRGYNLPCKYVIHCVGPRDGDPHLLASTYQTALDLVLEHNIKTIAFPCVACGLNSFPVEASAQLVLQLLRRWLETDNNYLKIDKIILNLWTQSEINAYSKWVQSAFPLPTTLTFEEGLKKEKVSTLLKTYGNANYMNDWFHQFGYGDDEMIEDGSSNNTTEKKPDLSERIINLYNFNCQTKFCNYDDDEDNETTGEDLGGKEVKEDEVSQGNKK